MMMTMRGIAWPTWTSASISDDSLSAYLTQHYRLLSLFHLGETLFFGLLRFYLFSTRCFSIYPLARAHSHCQMMARVGTIWPDRHYIGCGLAISDQIVPAFDGSCQLRRWPVGWQSSVTALRPIWTQPRIYNDDEEEEKLLDVATSSVSGRGSSKSSGGFVDASLSRDSQDRVPRLCFSFSTSVYNTSHCIVDSTIQKNPPWRCDHLRRQRKPQVLPTMVPLSYKLRPCLL